MRVRVRDGGEAEGEGEGAGEGEGSSRLPSTCPPPRRNAPQLLLTMSAAHAATSTGLSRKSLSWRAVYSCSLARHSGARSVSAWCALRQLMTAPPRAGTPGQV